MLMPSRCVIREMGAMKVDSIVPSQRSHEITLLVSPNSSDR